MVEVFKTNVDAPCLAEPLLKDLNKRFPQAKINFDLADCDNILRVETMEDISNSIKKLLVSKGFFCEVLPG